MFDQIKAVIFDMDGTLLDSMHIWRQIDEDFLNSRGLSMRPDLQERPGLRRATIWRRALRS